MCEVRNMEMWPALPNPCSKTPTGFEILSVKQIWHVPTDLLSQLDHVSYVWRSIDGAAWQIIVDFVSTCVLNVLVPLSLACLCADLHGRHTACKHSAAGDVQHTLEASNSHFASSCMSIPATCLNLKQSLSNYSKSVVSLVKTNANDFCIRQAAIDFARESKSKTNRIQNSKPPNLHLLQYCQRCPTLVPWWSPWARKAKSGWCLAMGRGPKPLVNDNYFRRCSVLLGVHHVPDQLSDVGLHHKLPNIPPTLRRYVQIAKLSPHLLVDHLPTEHAPGLWGVLSTSTTGRHRLQDRFCVHPCNALKRRWSCPTGRCGSQSPPS